MEDPEEVVAVDVKYVERTNGEDHVLFIISLAGDRRDGLWLSKDMAYSLMAQLYDQMSPFGEACPCGRDQANG